jgi:hypothetical protein
MRKALALAVGVLATSVLVASLLAGSAAVFGLRAPPKSPTIESPATEPVWTETRWPYPIDQWGTGRAFVCAASDCGSKVELFIRPKIGYCNCATGVADDEELERVGDTALISPKVQPQGRGRVIKAGWMKGLSRAYQVADRHDGVLSVAYNDECDVVAAVATFGGGDAAKVERAVMTFLNSNPMVLWAKKELGLEFFQRSW